MLFLILSQLFNRAGILKDLIAAGADVNTSDLAGNTPLHMAVYSGLPEIVRLLIEQGKAHPAKPNRWTRLVVYYVMVKLLFVFFGGWLLVFLP